MASKRRAGPRPRRVLRRRTLASHRVRDGATANGFIGQTISASAIVAVGVFYVAFFTLHLGLAIWVNSLWLVATFVATVAIIARVVVPREEQYLTGRFGSEYLEYKASVRRWL